MPGRSIDAKNSLLALSRIGPGGYVNAEDQQCRALEFIPPERLVITTDCGFGREGLSRRIAYYKCVSLVEGTNIVRRELGLPKARVRASDPALYFDNVARHGE